jgi:hypothetical protein
MAIGQPTTEGQAPSANERTEATITLMMAGLVGVAVVGISIQIIKRINAKIPASVARPVYPQLIKTPKRGSHHDFCTTPEHSPGGPKHDHSGRRKKM